MVDRNPEKSGTTGIPMFTLAATQMDQWDEKEVPAELKQQAITTKLGNARNWVPKADRAPGEPVLSFDMYRQRQHKENLDFHFDDNKKVQQIDVDQFILINR